LTSIGSVPTAGNGCRYDLESAQSCGKEIESFTMTADSFGRLGDEADPGSEASNPLCDDIDFQATSSNKDFFFIEKIRSK
jgi:hypothetical protein